MLDNLQPQAEKISNWLSQTSHYLEAQGAVFELRGDITSAVTAALAQKSFGSNALGLIMMCHTSVAEVQAARLLAKQLGIPFELVDLTEAFDLLAKKLPQTSSHETHTDLVVRLRTLTLYQYASARNSLVLGTLSKSDWEIGDFTRYGGDAADLFPLLHLFKTELQILAEHLGLPDFKPQDSADSAQRAGLLAGLTQRQLDACLAGNPIQLSKATQEQIRDLQHAAVSKRLTRFPLSLLEGNLAKETQSHEIQETYDKSIEALTLISKAITSDQYLEDILRLIVMVTAEVMNSSVCSLWLLDDKEGVMRLRATQSIDSEYLKDRVLKAGEGVVGKVVGENRPYIVSNVLTDPYYKEKELAKRMGLVSMLSVPMRVKERVIGVINCYTSHPHSFSDMQMNVLTTVANQAAVAIEKTELMVQTKVIQEELERRKIIERAKDLLMARLNLPGEEAYRWLQKRSMNTRKSMREVAEAVILTMEG